MFNKYLFFSFSLLFLSVGVTIWFLSPSQKTEQIYKQLSNYNQNKKKEAEHQNQQYRIGINKQLFYKEGPNRLETCLTSERSKLNYGNYNQKEKFIEHLENVVCTAQEKLFYQSKENSDHLESHPMQWIRQLSAQEAVYVYQTGEIEAKTVKFNRYLLAGHHLFGTLSEALPFFVGRAERFNFSLTKENVFKAECFQGVFCLENQDL